MQVRVIKHITAHTTQRGLLFILSLLRFSHDHHPDGFRTFPLSDIPHGSEMSTGWVNPRVGSGRDGARFVLITDSRVGQVENSRNLFSLLKVHALIADQNLHMLTHPCDVQFTMFYFVVHYA